MTKRNLLKFHCFGHWNISVLVIVSDFEIRISNFLPKNRGFRSDTNYGLCDGKISQFRQKTRPILTLLGQSWVENARKNVCLSHTMGQN
jgi:hypothetical protein